MKKIILTSAIVIAMVALSIGLLGCKEMNSNDDTKKITLDISGLLAQLPVSSSSSASSSQSVSQSSQMSSQVSSPPENDAQSAVKTLMVVPLTYSKHGTPYSSSDFSQATEEDLEDDAINSAGFLQFIQLPTSGSTVELEVPTVSDGWQLVAAATSETVESADKLEDAKIYYIGFTTQAFKSAEEFNSANPTLTLKRHCDQDAVNRPNGCATFDGNKDGIVTSAVEIHELYINGIPQSCSALSGGPFPWDVSTDALAVTRTTNLTDCVDNDWAGGTITSLKLNVTHKQSDGKSIACQTAGGADTTTDYYNKCSGFQTYIREY